MRSILIQPPQMTWFLENHFAWEQVYMWGLEVDFGCLSFASVIETSTSLNLEFAVCQAGSPLSPYYVPVSISIFLCHRGVKELLCRCWRSKLSSFCLLSIDYVSWAIFSAHSQFWIYIIPIKSHVNNYLSNNYH